MIPVSNTHNVVRLMIARAIIEKSETNVDQQRSVTRLLVDTELETSFRFSKYGTLTVTIEAKVDKEAVAEMLENPLDSRLYVIGL